jgi:hypothetical protein
MEKSMKRADMVRRGAQELIEAENAVDEALRKVTGLTSSLTEMRLRSNLSMAYGQEVVTALVTSAAKLAEVRGTMLVAHEHLNDVKGQLGCRTVAVGTLDKPEDDKKGLMVVGSNERNVA